MNSLISNYATSSDTDSTNSSDSEQDKTSNKSATDNQYNELPKPKLPTPTFNPDDTQNTAQTSVFKNPFSEAETSKVALLQKHVKMVENKDNVITINGKKICWNYRKGRCRFGHNCKFAHDSDIELTKEQLNNKSSDQMNSNTNKQVNLIQNISQDPTEDIDGPPRKKTKRPGLTQGLIPGKKVMKQYLNTQKTGI